MWRATKKSEGPPPRSFACSRPLRVTGSRARHRSAAAAASLRRFFATTTSDGVARSPPQRRRRRLLLSSSTGRADASRSRTDRSHRLLTTTTPLESLSSRAARVREPPPPRAPRALLLGRAQGVHAREPVRVSAAVEGARAAFVRGGGCDVSVGSGGARDGGVVAPFGGVRDTSVVARSSARREIPSRRDATRRRPLDRQEGGRAARGL